MAAQTSQEVRFLTPQTVDVKRKKYCRFKKSGIILVSSPSGKRKSRMKSKAVMRCGFVRKTFNVKAKSSMTESFSLLGESEEGVGNIFQ